VNKFYFVKLLNKFIISLSDLPNVLADLQHQIDVLKLAATNNFELANANSNAIGRNQGAIDTTSTRLTNYLKAVATFLEAFIAPMKLIPIAAPLVAPFEAFIAASRAI
jgi:hypothetical protein